VLTTGSALTFDGTNLTATNGVTVQGLTVGRGAGSVATNTAVGASALAANTSGYENVAVGAISLTANTTGTFNTAVGRASLYSNTTGSSNTAHGNGALQNNTTASDNTAVGYQAGYSNTTGARNTFVGEAAGYLVTTGSDNTTLGFGALASGGGSGGSAANNVAIGTSALKANTASNNTAVGYQAGYSTTTVGYNTYMGSQAGYSNVTGTANTAIGRNAGYSTTSDYNTFVGQGAGYYVTSGAKNTILGQYNGNQGGLDIRTASNYIVLSDGDGSRQITTAEGKTLALGGSAVPQTGRGITFPASQDASSDANTLDDYEEGTFTLTANISSGSITLGNNTCSYRKVGSTVFIYGFITCSARSSPSGSMNFSGLPFASKSGSAYWGGNSPSDYLSGKTKLYIAGNGTTSMDYSYYNDNAVSQDVTTSWNMIINLSYVAAN
jgi:hypothetical protein